MVHYFTPLALLAQYLNLGNRTLTGSSMYVSIIESQLVRPDFTMHVLQAWSFGSIGLENPTL